MTEKEQASPQQNLKIWEIEIMWKDTENETKQDLVDPFV